MKQMAIYRLPAPLASRVMLVCVFEVTEMQAKQSQELRLLRQRANGLSRNILDDKLDAVYGLQSANS